MPANPQLLLFGQRLRALREERGLSQESFALEVGLARSYYGAVERGLRNVAVLNVLRIADTLEVEVGELFPPIQDFRSAQRKAVARKSRG